MSKIYIGTSGFSYPSWKGIFYPANLKPAEWLSYYSTQFNTLELNSTFYKFPEVKNLRKMFDATPEDFTFSVKANQKITHIMLMKNAKDTVNEFTEMVAEGLDHKLSNILFQFPPSFRYTEENLSNILHNITYNSKNVLEFRHASWWNEEVIQILREHHLTFCSVSFPALSEEITLTTNNVYVRMHGVPELFKSSYSDEELKSLRERLPSNAEKIFIYFNNTTFEAGFTNARTMEILTGSKLISSMSAR